MIYTIYRVKPGDTLSEISRSFGLTLDELWKINPQIQNIDTIQVNEPINVPVKKTSNIEISDDIPSWYAVAKQEMETGIQEISGSTHNPRIIEYHQATSLKATDDETAWCSSFVNWCMQQVGLEGTNSAAARSWLNWGAELNQPKEGCIVVFRRGSSSWQGHVGFFTGIVGNHILTLGGNQGNEVNISSYSEKNQLGFRWNS
ncbi:MAG: LysM peptidoglycan-binding domain-containing protein [Desulfobacteraceae bacterium]|nr:LysM peptidoglycan-binding domain-containing protein [Desulfobacteraceae bacterium]